MGGMGFIETHKADCMLSVLINTHMLLAARDAGVERFFSRSSACVYTADKQVDADVTALKEADAYPAMPEDGYGWEKLFSERMCRHFREDFGLQTRVARYHNVYGPIGSYDGGREKAPAALCRKIAEAVLTGKHEIEIWGDGEQTRSFMYVDDCVEGTMTDGHRRQRRAGQRRQFRIGDASTRWSASSSKSPESPSSATTTWTPQGRARAQQRQHADQGDLRLGAVDHDCATAWSAPTAGSTTSWHRASPRRSSARVRGWRPGR